MNIEKACGIGGSFESRHFSRTKCSSIESCRIFLACAISSEIGSDFRGAVLQHYGSNLYLFKFILYGVISTVFEVFEEWCPRRLELLKGR